MMRMRFVARVASRVVSGSAPRPITRPLTFIRALSTTPRPGPEAEWSTIAKLKVLGAAVAAVGGLYAQYLFYLWEQPDFKTDKAKKLVEAAFKRPALKPKPAMGQEDIDKEEIYDRPDVVFIPNVGSIPVLEWDKTGLKRLLLKSGVIFLFKESGSGKTTSIKALVDEMNGYTENNVEHRFLFVPLRKTATDSPGCMSPKDAFAKACNVNNAYKDFSFKGYNAFIEENQRKGVVYHLILDDVQAAMRDPAFNEWSGPLSGLIASGDLQRLVLIGSEDVESSLMTKLSGASSRLDVPTMPTPTEKEVETYLTETIGLSDAQAKRFVAEVGCYMGFITKFVGKLLPQEYKITNKPILKKVEDKDFDAAMSVVSQVILKKLKAAQEILPGTDQGAQAWKALVDAATKFNKELKSGNDPQDLEKRRRAILTQALGNDLAIKKLLKQAKLIVETHAPDGNKPEYDWYFVGYSKEILNM